MSYKRIEFIGAPAVGKSTLLRELLKSRRTDDTWKTPSEALVRLARNQKCDLFPPDLRTFMILVLRINVFNKGRGALISSILEGFKNPAVLSSWSACNGLLEMLFSWLAAADHLEPYDKAKVVAYYLALLKQHAVLEHYSAPWLVVEDEGIIHNNPKMADRDAYRTVLQRDPRIGARVQPVGIVHCNLSLDAFCTRRKKRIASGRGIFLDKPLRNDEFRVECRRMLDVAARKVELQNELGTPVMEVDMAGSPAENAPGVLRFLRDTAATGCAKSGT